MKNKSKIINLKFLKLKNIIKSEIEVLRKERNSISVRSKMLDQKIISKKNQIKWYEKIKKDKNSKFFSIYYKNKIIGSGSLTNLNKQNKNCTWGFYIFNKYLGYFGVLAQYKIIQYAFKKYNFHKIYGKTLSTNYQILKIHRKFGFRTEGTLKEQIFIKKKKIDIVLTALYKRDWIKNKKKIRLIFT